MQTPIGCEGAERLSIGDPIFMRHSKTGELYERFNTLLLIKNGAVEDEVNVCRGQGPCFL